MATMVSVAENTPVTSIQQSVVSSQSDAATGRLLTYYSPLTTDDYRRLEISTVFEKASPTLSVAAPEISATAMWTIRRSYGLSGPSC